MLWLSNLKRMKEASGLTTKQIADQSGLPEPTLEKIFAGATKDPKLETMRQLVYFLGYSLDELVGGDSPKESYGTPQTEFVELIELKRIYCDRLNAEGRKRLMSHARYLTTEVDCVVAPPSKSKTG